MNSFFGSNFFVLLQKLSILRYYFIIVSDIIVVNERIKINSMRLWWSYCGLVKHASSKYNGCGFESIRVHGKTFGEVRNGRLTH